MQKKLTPTPASRILDLDLMPVEVREHHLGNLIIGFAVLVIAMSLCVFEFPQHWRAIAGLFVFVKMTAATLMSVVRFERRVLFEALRQSEQRLRTALAQSARAASPPTPTAGGVDISRIWQGPSPSDDFVADRDERPLVDAAQAMSSLARSLGARVVGATAYYGFAIALALALSRYWGI